MANKKEDELLERLRSALRLVQDLYDEAAESGNRKAQSRWFAIESELNRIIWD